MAFQHLAMAHVCQRYIHTPGFPLHRVPLLQLVLHLCSGIARALLNQSLQLPVTAHLQVQLSAMSRTAGNPCAVVTWSTPAVGCISPELNPDGNLCFRRQSSWQSFCFCIRYYLLLKPGVLHFDSELKNRKGDESLPSENTPVLLFD